MTTTAESTEAAQASTDAICPCGHEVSRHGSTAGCLALGGNNAFCPCELTHRLPVPLTRSLGIMPEPVAQDLLRQVEAIDQVLCGDPMPRSLAIPEDAGGPPPSCTLPVCHDGIHDTGGKNRAQWQRVSLSDRCLHGLPLGLTCERCDEVIGAAKAPVAAPARCQCGHAELHHGTHGCKLAIPGRGWCHCSRFTASATEANAGAIPTAVVGELAGPHVVDGIDPRHVHESACAWDGCGDRRTRSADAQHADQARVRRARALADLNAEVARAAASASAAARHIAERHSAEWAALTDKAVAGVTDPRQRARLLRTVAHAIELSTRQGCDLMLSAHDVLDAEPAKLTPARGMEPNARPTTVAEPTIDELISGDPTTVCRALWRGEAAEDGALAIAALEEWVHGHVGERELEDRFAELLSELLLVLGGPHSATS